jgi:predicted Fe-Mo cluster-binding NifX family protein
MERVAIPVFESRVSPVLDSCQRIVVVDFENGREIRRQELSLEKMSVHERIEVMVRWGIRKIICAGVSDVMCRFLAGKNIVLVSGIAGELEKIINAYICNRLDDACFIMPGKRNEKK